MIVERFRALEIVGFSRRSFLSERSESLVNRHQRFRAQVTLSFSTACGVGCFLLASHAVSNLDSFAAVSRLRINHTDIVGIIPVLNLFPFHWDVQLFFDHSLKGISLGQRYPDAGL